LPIDGISEVDLTAARRIWEYHHLHHELRPTSVAIGLGSHDIGVATLAAELYFEGLFPVLVFSGGNSPATAPRFPGGEACAFRLRAIDLGVPPQAILVEPCATNTGENIRFSRELLHNAAVPVSSVMLISMPGMERRAYATCLRVCPEVEVVSASQNIDFEIYLQSFGDPRLVINDLVGDLQRVIEYPRMGFAVLQDVPPDVRAAYEHLVRAGFASRLLPV
jgi:uncharacterized SAM-binding protein YcdF (DUF218 family)